MIKRVIGLILLTAAINNQVMAEKPVIGYPEIRLANFERMQEIVDQGTDLNAFDSDDFSPLFLAVWLGEIEVAKFLIDNGADVNLVRNDGATPIYLSPNGEMINFLISQGANLEHTSPYGFTPLTLAIYYQRIRIAEHLVKMGADVNVMKLEGRTPLNILNERKNTEQGKREQRLRELIIAAGGKDIVVHNQSNPYDDVVSSSEDSNCSEPSEDQNKRNINSYEDCDNRKQ